MREAQIQVIQLENFASLDKPFPAAFESMPLPSIIAEEKNKKQWTEYISCLGRVHDIYNRHYKRLL